MAKLTKPRPEARTSAPKTARLSKFREPLKKAFSRRTKVGQSPTDADERLNADHGLLIEQNQLPAEEVCDEIVPDSKHGESQSKKTLPKLLDWSSKRLRRMTRRNRDDTPVLTSDGKQQTPEAEGSRAGEDPGNNESRVSSGVIVIEEDNRITLPSTPVRPTSAPGILQSPQSEGSPATLVNSPNTDLETHAHISGNFSRSIKASHAGITKEHQAQIEYIHSEAQDLEEIDWLRALYSVQSAREGEIAEMRTEAFTATGVIQGLENDIANNQDDYEYNYKELQEEKDQAVRQLAECKVQNDFVTERRARLQREVRNLKKERDSLKQQLDESEQRFKEAKAISEDAHANVNATACAYAKLTRELEASKTKTRDLELANERSLEEIEELSEQLQSTVNTIRECRAARTKAEEELKRAEAECSWMHTLNSNYRYVLEGENPARTAHFDGMLRQKDIEFQNLEKRADRCSEELAKSENARTVERIELNGKIEGLEAELKDRFDKLEALEESRDSYKHHNESILEFLKRKLYKDDVIQLCQEQIDILNKDNAFLISLVQDRNTSIELATTTSTELKTTIANLEAAASSTTIQIRDLKADVNGLNLRKNMAEAAAEANTTEITSLQSTISSQTAEIATLNNIAHQRNPSLEAKDHEIANLKDQLTRAVNVNNQWQNRWQAHSQGMDPFWQVGEFWHGGDEERRLRLKFAEREVERLKRLLAGRDRGGDGNGSADGEGVVDGEVEVEREGGGRTLTERMFGSAFGREMEYRTRDGTREVSRGNWSADGDIYDAD